jgi:hypothetical protein
MKCPQCRFNNPKGAISCDMKGLLRKINIEYCRYSIILFNKFLAQITIIAYFQAQIWINI